MQYRRFGKTGLNMPCLSFGGMRSMHSWVDQQLTAIPADNQQHLRQLLHTALAHGITHLETARGYGSSERQLGALLSELPRDNIIVQTKVGPQADVRLFVDSVHDSLRRLQLPRVDLLAIHGINDYRSLWQTCRPGGCLAAARELQRQGIAGHIGFSGHGSQEVIRDAIAHQEDGGFDYVNLHWYYIFDANRQALALAQARDMGVFIISPTDKGGMLYQPSPLLKELCAPLSPILLNDLYCLNQPEVHTISIGAARPGDFDEHLKALKMLDKNPEATIGAIRQRLEDTMRQRTGHSRPDALWEQLPGWEDTPGYINLRFCLWLANLATGWDMLDFARYRYALLGDGNSWVAGNNCRGIRQLSFAETRARYPAVSTELIDTLARAHQLLKKGSRPTN